MKYFTIIGNHDAIDKNHEGFGAALTIFFHYIDDISAVYLFASPDKPDFSYINTAEKIKRRMLQERKDLPIDIIELDIANPVNFNLVYKVLLNETQNIIVDNNIKDNEKIINITSGTPTMSTCWVLLQKSGLIPNAQLVQSFEPRFQRQYGKTCQVVDLTIDDFPEINTLSKEKLELNRVHEELKILKEEQSVNSIDRSMPNLIGKSEKMRVVKDQILQLIDTNTHVLILGELGTGKEIIAKSIWDIYRKNIDKEFNPFDCGQFDPNLIISELFGYEKGAFTGANKQKIGIIEVNNGRMLYLDEIGNIPLENQGVFLRFLQFGEWKRVSSTKTNKSQIQVVAATNKDIYDKSVFRADLKDRFHEIIELPPLRERHGDIRLLTEYFLVKINKNISFDSTVYKKIENFSWPGNVRQLEMWVKRICRRYKDIQLSWDEIPSILHPDNKKDDKNYDFPELPVDYNRFTTDFRLHALEMANGNKSKADRLLGMKDGTMKQWMHQRMKRKN